MKNKQTHEAKNIHIYMDTLESTYARPYVALWFYSLRAEEEDLEAVHLQK